MMSKMATSAVESRITSSSSWLSSSRFWIETRMPPLAPANTLVWVLIIPPSLLRRYSVSELPAAVPAVT